MSTQQEESKVIPAKNNPKEIEKLLRSQIRTKTLTDDAFVYMSLLVNEDCPKNAAELVSLIGDFMTDGMSYSDDEAFKHCETIIRILIDQKMILVENRDTIVAEKLLNPITINEIKESGHSRVYREEEFLDPFLDADKTEGNYNVERKNPFGPKFKKTKEEERAQDALDKKIEEFIQHKKHIPPPIVIHDKPDPFKADILINNLTLIIGGKTLLDQAQLKLVQGRKYGLVGRNGIGKTTLINAITRKEIEKFPQNVHILQVEQEAEADDKTVLQHVLGCDVERDRLLAEMHEIQDKGASGTETPEEKEDNTKKLSKIFERL